MDKKTTFYPEQRVKKTGGDYTFSGEIRSILTKRSGAQRVVVENDEGILHIFNPAQLTADESAIHGRDVEKLAEDIVDAIRRKALHPTSMLYAHGLEYNESDAKAAALEILRKQT